MPDSRPIDPLRSALFTDMYELTMAQAYDAEGMDRKKRAAVPYPVEVSDALNNDLESLRKALEASQLRQTQRD